MSQLSFKIPSFKELISMSKEALEESMLPLRERAAKAKAESLKVDLETKLLELEGKIKVACAAKEPDFSKVADLLDDHALTKRRLEQITAIVGDLFPVIKG